MIKKVKVKDLSIGMYVHDFNCGWLSHPFYKSQMLIKDDQLIEKIIKTGIHEIYIDTAKGKDLSTAPTAAEANRKLNSDLRKSFKRTVKHPTQSTSEVNRTTYHEEIKKAHTVKEQAREHMGKVLANAATGEKLDLEGIAPMVDNMVESITRNENALISLLRVKKVDEYTFMHSMSVGALLIAFAKHVELNDEEIKNIGIGGMLHDIGKMQIPINVLNKPARLTDEEFQQIKDHVVHSHRLLEKNSDLDPLILQVAGEHHERYDGTGYPAGLSGDGISLGGQMAAIVDVYDALSSDRIYHKGLSPAETVKKLYEWGKFHFNSELVHKFIAFIGIYPVGTVVRLDNGKIGVVIEANRTTPTVRVVHDITKNRPTRQYDINLAVGMGRTIRVVDNEEPGDWDLDVAAILATN